MADASLDTSSTWAVLCANMGSSQRRLVQFPVNQAPIQSEGVPNRMSYAIIGTKPSGSAFRNHIIVKVKPRRICCVALEREGWWETQPSAHRASAVDTCYEPSASVHDRKLRDTVKTLDDTMIDFAPLPRARMVVGDLSRALHAPFGVHGIALCGYLFGRSIT